MSWSQATLPIKYGGIGIRASSSIALPAFLSSVYSTNALVNEILSISSSSDVTALYAAEARVAWSDACPGESIPTDACSQHNWDEPCVKQVHKLLLNNCNNDSDRARLLAVSAPESGHWLHALPSENIGTMLDPSTLRIVVGLRLGLEICAPHHCPCSRCVVDTMGRHGLSCIKSAGRLFRHASINDLVRRALVTAGVPASLEPCGLSRDDGKRPDGATLVPWALGRTLVWDATCVDTFAPSHIKKTSARAGAAAEEQQALKRRKYSSLLANHEFAALAVETMGPWSSDTSAFIKELSSRLVLASGDLRAGAYFAQRLSLAIQRGNAASVLGSMPNEGGLDDVFAL